MRRFFQLPARTLGSILSSNAADIRSTHDLDPLWALYSESSTLTVESSIPTAPYRAGPSKRLMMNPAACLPVKFKP